MSDAELFKFDVRVRGRMLRLGHLTEEQCKRHLERLKDAADNAEALELQQPALIRTQEELPLPPVPRAQPEPAAAPEPEPEPAVPAPGPEAAAPEPEPEPEEEPEPAAAAPEPEVEPAAAAGEPEPEPEPLPPRQDREVDSGWDGGLFDDEGDKPS